MMVRWKDRWVHRHALRDFVSGVERFQYFPIALLLAIAVGCGGGGDGDGPTEPEQTAEELTQSGWSMFDQGDLSGALEKFDAAIARDVTHGPAYVGQGWSRLSLATNSQGLIDAVSSFDEALTRGQQGAEVRAGKAAANLGLGGGSLPEAISEARAARQSAPAFAFSHRQSFNVSDLRLIESFAHAGQANLEAALASADSVKEVREVLDGMPRELMLSITRSLGKRTGKLNELMATFELTQYDRLFYLGDPIDFVGIKYDEGIDFIEVKTGRARFTEDELKLKDLIECKMVNYMPLSVKRINFAEEVSTEDIEAEG